LEENIVTRHRDTESARLWLRSLVAQLLNIDENDVATDQPLGEFGIDSLTAAEFSAEIEDQTGVNAPMEQFLGQYTLEDIARELVDRAPESGADLAEVPTK
jgi:acyl carrier protein